MTEAEWLACDDPAAILNALGGKGSERKRRLLICGCCRRLWPLLREPSMRSAIEIGEGHADDEDFNDQAEHYDAAAAPLFKEITPEIGNTGFAGYGRQCLIQAVLALLTPIGGTTLTVAGTTDALRYAAEGASQDAVAQTPPLAGRWAEVRRQEALSREIQAQSALTRDVFGPILFRPDTLDPRWRTETVVPLAAGIYADRAFDRLPILADALEDAGCDNADILTHCRGDGPHVRGCWVVDLVLGKR